MNNIQKISSTKCGSHVSIFNEKGELIAQGRIEPRLPEGAKAQWLETFHGVTDDTERFGNESVNDDESK